MSGHVFYKFPSQRDQSTVSFEGTGITVFDLKRDIIEREHLGKSADFDFAIYHAETGEEYRNDETVIPRATSVLARRMPASRPGKGNVQIYAPDTFTSTVSTSTPGSHPQSHHASSSRPNPAGAFSRRFDSKNDSNAANQRKTVAQPEAPISSAALGEEDEAAKIAAMFEAEDEQWKLQQDKMASAQFIPQFSNGRPQHSGPGGGFKGPGGGGGGGPRNFEYTQKAVPPGYVCYRCGQKGHWIQDCPTNENKDFDNKPRIKRTTGIPRSFLTSVEGPGSASEGVMVTPEGGFVVARPDNITWQQRRKLIKRNLKEEDVQNMQPSDPDLACPICSKLLRDSVKTPCCQTAYCEKCIIDHINDNDNVCPECESFIKDESVLKIDTDRRQRVREYIDEMVKSSKEQSQDDHNLSSTDATQNDETSENGDVQAKRSTSPEATKNAAQKPEIKSEKSISSSISNSSSQANNNNIKSSSPAKSETQQSSSSPHRTRTKSPESAVGSNSADHDNNNINNMNNNNNTNTNTNSMNQMQMPNGQNMANGGNMVNMGMVPPNMMQQMMNNINNQNNMMMSGNPQQQQQQQQQLQQQMMMQQQPQQNDMMPNPMVIQQMLQQTMHQFHSNPNLPPAMRMQLQMQIQQLQNMAMQLQMQQGNGNGNANMNNMNPMGTGAMHPGMNTGPMNPMQMNQQLNRFPGMNFPQGQMGMGQQGQGFPQGMMNMMPNAMNGQMPFNNQFPQQQQQHMQFGMNNNNNFVKNNASKGFRYQNQQQQQQPQQSQLGGNKHAVGQKRKAESDNQTDQAKVAKQSS